jgi:hypothetical protein
MVSPFSPSERTADDFGSRPFADRAFFCRDSQLVDQSARFIARTPALRAMVVLEIWARLAYREPRVDVRLIPHRHSSESPFCHRGGKVPATNNQARTARRSVDRLRNRQRRQRLNPSTKSARSIQIHIPYWDSRIFSTADGLDVRRKLLAFLHNHGPDEELDELAA